MFATLKFGARPLLSRARQAAGSTKSLREDEVTKGPHSDVITGRPWFLEVIDCGDTGAAMVLLTGSGDNAHVYDKIDMWAFLDSERG